ncbi:CoA pyrophosphatase [Massilia psychrophila]|jgi:8-oxo-dGTP pyrophosphatase MutT (NUDIX family)|uniref:CoA pyrophosphatase n=1 Tax=Massilia psychrophila TaxID=1603353 RepID=A0A2G8T544_9BURK|nr:CoA pyrophosphatase [Massilia psychrophila]PIL41093.1 CoA pyrophosphatase [Massilia psychrophila]
MHLPKLSFDPEQLPIESVGGEAPVEAARLTAGWLRGHFAAPPAWQPEALDESVGRRPVMIAASVLIPLVARPDGLTMLLTRRTDHLNHHAGQISFPGGRAEQVDLSPVDTALREAREEIGLERHHVEIIGQLPDYLTGTGYHITPVVGLLMPPFELVADPGEVAEIFEVPLAHLMNGAHHQRLSIDLPAGGRRSFYAMPYGRYFIWGATAGMLRNLFHFLRV